MKINLGTVDRVLRALVGVVIGVAILTGNLSGTWAWVLGIAGTVLVLTAMASRCPIYWMLGVHTTKKAC